MSPRAGRPFACDNIRTTQKLGANLLKRSPKIEQLLFRKIELWVLIVVSIGAVIAMILFGWISRQHTLLAEESSFGKFGDLVTWAADGPEIIERVIEHLKREVIVKGETSPNAAAEQRFKGARGFEFHFEPNTRPELGYLLINRSLADGRASSELWDLNAQERVHQWQLTGVEEVWKKSVFSSKKIDLLIDKTGSRFVAFHAFLNPNGHLLTHSQDTPLVEIDLCSDIRIFQDALPFHHSIEQDHNGNFWVPGLIDPSPLDKGNGFFRDDALIQISPRGDILTKVSVASILKKNGLNYLINGAGPHNFANADPLHLNDIEPVKEDGPFWKAGDLFLSLRNLSMILLYRPSEEKVIWYRRGPWLHQHDVDVISNHEISVFDNNLGLDTARSSLDFMLGSSAAINQLLVYDFREAAVTAPWRAGFENLSIKGTIGGLSTVIGSEIVVEETAYGRLAQFDKDGSVAWVFFNQDEDGVIYALHWSRVISRGLGDRVRRALETSNCS